MNPLERIEGLRRLAGDISSTKQLRSKKFVDQPQNLPLLNMTIGMETELEELLGCPNCGAQGLHQITEPSNECAECDQFQELWNAHRNELQIFVPKFDLNLN